MEAQTFEEFGRALGAIVPGHFPVKEGEFHSNFHIATERLLAKDVLDRMVGVLVNRHLETRGELVDTSVDIVVGVGEKGFVLAERIASFLVEATEGRRPVRPLMARKRGVAAVGLAELDLCHLSGRNVLVVTDAIWTGGCVRQTIKAIVGCGGNQIGVSALVRPQSLRRGDVGGAKVHALYADVELWPAADCRLCRRSTLGRALPLSQPCLGL
jgi:adenine/guanine phosphoribosyltransferase-like PRPP-binding protein